MGIDQACSVKKAGYWLRSFLLRVYGPRRRSIKNVIKGRGQYPAIFTDQAWSIKDLLHGKMTLLSCGTQRVIASEQDSAILPAPVANHIAGFTNEPKTISLSEENGVSGSVNPVYELQCNSRLRKLLWRQTDGPC